MKTILPQSINTIDQAKAFLTDLFNNNETFHPDDDAHETVWSNGERPTPAEADQLNKLMCDIDDLQLDPCEILMDLFTRTKRCD